MALLWSSSAAAQPAVDTRLGHAADGLPGLGRVALPRTVPWTIALSGSAGYGMTESVLGVDDTHHRLLGRLALSAQPAPWLAISLQLDGRYDTHSVGGVRDSGLVGDPRLLVRGWYESNGLGLGAQLTGWLPGENAPSIVFGATTLDLEALGSYAVTPDVVLALNAGYRLDRSAESVDDPSRLSSADRISLGLSGFDAMLLGLGGAYRAGAVELYGEWSWDMLLGSDAPSALESPMRLGAGVRVWLAEADAIQLELGFEALLSSRPDLANPAVVIPIEPRFNVHAGLTFRFPAPTPPTELEDDGDGGNGDLVVPPPRELATIRGQVQDTAGAPVPDAEVVLRRAGQNVGAAATTDAEGRFEFTNVEPAPDLSVLVTADGFRDGSAEVAVEAGGTADTALSLERALPGGQIRGIVQAFSGEALAATIRVEPLGQEAQTSAEDGVFTIDVPPGDYEVVVSSSGYEEQRRPVHVEENGVTILNVDMRRGRR